MVFLYRALQDTLGEEIFLLSMINLPKKSYLTAMLRGLNTIRHCIGVNMIRHWYWYEYALEPRYLRLAW